MVLDKSGSVASAQSSMLAFVRELLSQFSLSAESGAQVGLVEFSNDAATLSELSASSAAVSLALDGASAAGGGTSVSDGLALGLSVHPHPRSSPSPALSEPPL